MSQNPIDSGTQSSKVSGLKPELAAALASLEVPLDQELARYRRTRIGVRMPNQSRMGSYIGNQSQDLMDATATDGQTPLSVAEINTNTTPAFILNETPQEHPAPPTATTEAVNSFNVPTNTESNKTQKPSSNAQSSIVPTVVNAHQSENLAQANDTSQPDDYLESSEALLRSLTDEQTQTEKPSNANETLLSPLGIGSMLLLLLASLTLGYVVFNPNSQGWSQFNLARLFPSNSSPDGENIEQVGSNTQPQVKPELTPIPKYPNLAAKEFPEVRDPTDVVGLQPKVQPIPSPIITPSPIIPPVVNSLPQSQPLPPLDSPSPATVQPSPQATTTPPNVNAQITPAADGFYHIVTDNQGDRALATAQKVVADAYLSPGKTLIYLGAVKTQAEAQQKVQQLQAKGIKARIQQP
ncbi:MAG: hypothetical protein KME59_01065 [Trichormus sp. ATA11-4-KO1]|jgi:hypothetical protein|nr:hypothetical protein [Trichormus sp. ATA11-4-KO1]